MKKTYKIEVDCAACADKMEQAAQKTEGVAAATVSFMTQKMKVEFADGADVEAVMRQVPSTSKAAGIMPTAAFLAPLMVISPKSGCPPSIIYCFIEFPFLK